MATPTVDRFQTSLDSLRRRALYGERCILSTVLTHGRSSCLPIGFEPEFTPHRLIADAIRSVSDSEDCGLVRIWSELCLRGTSGQVGVVRLAAITNAASLPPHKTMLDELAGEIATTWAQYRAAVNALQAAEKALEEVQA